MSAEAQPKPAPKVVEAPQLDETVGFDNRTHITDAKTGRLIRLQNYTKHARADKVMFERPIGSGNCYFENGQWAGNYEFVQKGNDVEWRKLSDTPKETKAAPINVMEEIMQRNEALEAELAALRAEAAKGTSQTLGQAQGHLHGKITR